MKEDIKRSIDARKDSFKTLYELTDDVEKEINDLFDKIHKFGETCSDSMDFETKFANNPLNQEYINLFTSVSSKCKAKTLPKEDDTPVKSTGEKVLEDIESEARYMADDLTYPARRKAREEFDSKLRDTPLGKVEQASNMFYLFKKFKKKKNKDEEE